jgi:DNA-damage-inducible protein D
MRERAEGEPALQPKFFGLQSFPPIKKLNNFLNCPHSQISRVVMKKEIILRLSQSFEETVRIEQDVEYWMARDLQVLFEYSSWDNFLNVIEKAKTACTNSKSLINSHFREVMKMVSLGSDSKREIPDLMLSRYACYLIAQNGDSRKEPIAFAQI